MVLRKYLPFEYLCKSIPWKDRLTCRRTHFVVKAKYSCFPYSLVFTNYANMFEIFIVVNMYRTFWSCVGRPQNEARLVYRCGSVFFCAPFVIIANVPIIFVSILSIWMS